ncbi:WEB family protein At5g16730, chloroplastic-like [Ctenocephalides felis]|uniref:WEB family protein At5g16730, chloroplastic-like n=1 Tax=Ctenocephalides felis TaxID=7515 RepID=UPI000E6E28D2|nr:WEB family protein At5g16730, chloroplastic-like [Ctenocephalides felis]
MTDPRQPIPNLPEATITKSPECSIPRLPSSSKHYWWYAPRAKKVDAKPSETESTSKYAPIRYHGSEQEIQTTNLDTYPSLIRYFDEDLPEDDEKSESIKSRSNEERVPYRIGKSLTFHKDVAVGQSSEDVSVRDDMELIFDDWHAHEKEYERYSRTRDRTFSMDGKIEKLPKRKDKHMDEIRQVVNKLISEAIDDKMAEISSSITMLTQTSSDALENFTEILGTKKEIRLKPVEVPEGEEKPERKVESEDVVKSEEPKDDSVPKDLEPKDVSKPKDESEPKDTTEPKDVPQPEVDSLGPKVTKSRKFVIPERLQDIPEPKIFEPDLENVSETTDTTQDDLKTRISTDIQTELIQNLDKNLQKDYEKSTKMPQETKMPDENKVKPEKSVEEKFKQNIELDKKPPTDAPSTSRPPRVSFAEAKVEKKKTESSTSISEKSDNVSLDDFGDDPETLLAPPTGTMPTKALNLTWDGLRRFVKKRIEGEITKPKDQPEDDKNKQDKKDK